MVDFRYLKIPTLDQWVVSAPKRAERPGVKNRVISCPFCPENDNIKEEVYRVGGEDNDRKWFVRVIKNKYPFAPIHEVVIHTPHHNKHFSDLSLDEMRMVVETFVSRFNFHSKSGTVNIFSNSGRDAGESIGHSHSQIAVVKNDVKIVVPSLERELDYRGEHFEVKDFLIVCPPYSQWPDEVWIIPKERGRFFGEIKSEEVESLSFILKRLVGIFEIRHGHKFPHNFYIYPYRDWYLRILSRAKIPGGFEISTGIFVDTQDPRETMQFIENHFYEEKEDKIKKSRAKYRRGV